MLTLCSNTDAQKPTPTQVARLVRFAMDLWGWHDSMNRDQLMSRLRARARRGGPAGQVWWNGELVHVSEALARASELPENEHIQARGDDVVIMRHLDPVDTLER